MILLRILNDDRFNIVFSILLGIGIVCIIRPLCIGSECSIEKPPVSDDFDKYVYKLGKKCYEFTPDIVECSKNEHAVEAFKECNINKPVSKKGNKKDNGFASRASIIKRCE